MTEGIALTIPDDLSVHASVTSSSGEVRKTPIDGSLTMMAGSTAQLTIKAQAHHATDDPLDLSFLLGVPAGIITGVAVTLGCIDDFGAKVLAELEGLACLLLPVRQEITAHGASILLGITTLSVLDLSFPKLTREHFAALATLPLLQLTLRGANDDGACADISRIACLERLALHGGSVSTAGIRALGALPRLNALELMGAAADLDWSAFGLLPALRELSVVGEHLTVADAKAMIGWPQELTSVRLLPLDVPMDLDLDIRQAHPNITFQSMMYTPRAVEKLRRRLAGKGD